MPATAAACPFFPEVGTQGTGATDFGPVRAGRGAQLVPGDVHPDRGQRAQLGARKTAIESRSQPGAAGQGIEVDGHVMRGQVDQAEDTRPTISSPPDREHSFGRVGQRLGRGGVERRVRPTDAKERHIPSKICAVSVAGPASAASSVATVRCP